ncbi:hypothetical protein Nepgr_013054 [Nepenthes gracilis]|uniref:Uncharacterized protein n=1 Tax=Nepenthes gracilis TaxID=150966 RepID=A0AAD3SH28_NEPGR|nr:hypothetical protein Nepgr_013054 [Nepenthes gracilis]
MCVCRLRHVQELDDSEKRNPRAPDPSIEGSGPPTSLSPIHGFMTNEATISVRNIAQATVKVEPKITTYMVSGPSLPRIPSVPHPVVQVVPSLQTSSPPPIIVIGGEPVDCEEQSFALLDLKSEGGQYINCIYIRVPSSSRYMIATANDSGQTMSPSVASTEGLGGVASAAAWDNIGEVVSLGTDLSSVAPLKGKDRAGHPVCYSMFGLLGNKELFQNTFGTKEKHDQFLRWRFQLMEKGTEELDFQSGGGTSILQINDLKNCPRPSKKELRDAKICQIEKLSSELPPKIRWASVPYSSLLYFALRLPTGCGNN